MKDLSFVILISVLLGTGCSSDALGPPKLVLPVATAFIDTIHGRATGFYTLKSASGIQASFSTYGARLVNLVVPDQYGNLTSIVIGFDSIVQYQRSTEPYLGATIGRYGNRIAKGKFLLNGNVYALPLNNGPNTLHGGTRGFQDKIWNAMQLDDSTLVFLYNAVDGEDGFPANLQTKVTYGLRSKEVTISYQATTDQPTVVNLTNHAFFNLNGEGSGSIEQHLLQIDADRYTPVDSTLIPTGVLQGVNGTPFDFRKATVIGDRINTDDSQLHFGKGYDHNFVLNGSGFRKVGSASGDRSGIVMEIWTDQPGLQFYTGNFMQSSNMLRGGVRDDFRTAFCLETQHFPDSPNQPTFPSTILRPGEVYHSESAYRFNTINSLYEMK